MVVASVGVHHPYVRHSAGEAHIGDTLAVGRKAWAGHGHPALGQIAVIGPVPVHDRDPLDRLGPRTGRGDIGDTAVEMAGMSRHSLDEGAGAAVGGALPVAGRDGEPRAGHLAALLEVVEVADDVDPTVIACLDVAGDEGARADVGPVGIERSPRFGRRVVPQIVGAHRVDRTARPKVGDDLPGDLDPDDARFSAVRLDVLRCRQLRNRDNQLGRAGLRRRGGGGAGQRGGEKQAC